MADTSPHETNHHQGPYRMPGQIAGRPPPTSAEMLLYNDVAERRCWRCLLMFPGDPTRAPTATAEWWLCEPCDRILLGPQQRAA